MQRRFCFVAFAVIDFRIRLNLRCETDSQPAAGFQAVTGEIGVERIALVNGHIIITDKLMLPGQCGVRGDDHLIVQGEIFTRVQAEFGLQGLLCIQFCLHIIVQMN